jgi:Tol biopolymer transport system component
MHPAWRQRYFGYFFQFIGFSILFRVRFGFGRRLAICSRFPCRFLVPCQLKGANCMFTRRKFLVHSDSSLALSTCLTLALLLGAGWCAATCAGKPAPPPPPPAPGKIFYRNFGTGNFGVWQMNGDGTGKTAVFTLPADATTPVPSLSSYGSGHRWWLVGRPSATDSNATDVYATKDGGSFIQLTSSGFTVNADGTETHLRVLGDPCWSNDGQDSFCSIRASHFVYDPVNLVYSDIHRTIYRLKISALDLEAGPINVPLHDGDSRLIPIITAGIVSGEPLRLHHWSADSTKITCVRYQSNTPYPDLYVANVSDLSGGPVNADGLTPIFYHTPNTYGVGGPRWSPPGTQPERIAFDCGGYLFTVPPDGTLPNPPSLTAGSQPYWSPDGKFIAYQKLTTSKSRASDYDIARIPSAGGSMVNLTADLDPTADKNVVGWSE